MRSFDAVNLSQLSGIITTDTSNTSPKRKTQTDTVEVAVLDPQEVRGAVADHGRHLSVLLPLQQHGHKMVDFIHVHVAHVVAADQHLDAQR